MRQTKTSRSFKLTNQAKSMIENPFLSVSRNKKELETRLIKAISKERVEEKTSKIPIKSSGYGIRPNEDVNLQLPGFLSDRRKLLRSLSTATKKFFHADAINTFQGDSKKGIMSKTISSRFRELATGDKVKNSFGRAGSNTSLRNRTFLVNQLMEDNKYFEGIKPGKVDGQSIKRKIRNVSYLAEISDRKDLEELCPEPGTKMARFYGFESTKGLVDLPENPEDVDLIMNTAEFPLLGQELFLALQKIKLCESQRMLIEKKQLEHFQNSMNPSRKQLTKLYQSLEVQRTRACSERGDCTSIINWLNKMTTKAQEIKFDSSTGYLQFMRKLIAFSWKELSTIEKQRCKQTGNVIEGLYKESVAFVDNLGRFTSKFLKSMSAHFQNVIQTNNNLHESELRAKEAEIEKLKAALFQSEMEATQFTRKTHLMRSKLTNDYLSIKTLRDELAHTTSYSLILENENKKICQLVKWVLEARDNPEYLDIDKLKEDMVHLESTKTKFDNEKNKLHEEQIKRLKKGGSSSYFNKEEEQELVESFGSELIAAAMMEGFHTIVRSTQTVNEVSSANYQCGPTAWADKNFQTKEDICSFCENYKIDIVSLKATLDQKEHEKAGLLKWLEEARKKDQGQMNSLRLELEEKKNENQLSLKGILRSNTDRNNDSILQFDDDYTPRTQMNQRPRLDTLQSFGESDGNTISQENKVHYIGRKGKNRNVTFKEQTQELFESSISGSDEFEISMDSSFNHLAGGLVGEEDDSLHHVETIEEANNILKQIKSDLKAIEKKDPKYKILKQTYVHKKRRFNTIFNRRDSSLSRLSLFQQSKKNNSINRSNKKLKHNSLLKLANSIFNDVLANIMGGVNSSKNDRKILRLRDLSLVKNICRIYNEYKSKMKLDNTYSVKFEPFAFKYLSTTYSTRQTLERNYKSVSLS